MTRLGLVIVEDDILEPLGKQIAFWKISYSILFKGCFYGVHTAMLSW